ncbi:uncharacterized protein LOC144144981 [Haemaphysalis longicornis]
MVVFLCACVIHRSQPARSDKHIPANFLHGLLLQSSPMTLPSASLPVPVGVILDPAFDRLLAMRPGHRRAGWCHRALQNAVRVELSVAVPVSTSLNPVRNRSTAFVVCAQSMWLAGSVGSSDLKYCVDILYAMLRTVL